MRKAAIIALVALGTAIPAAQALPAPSGARLAVTREQPVTVHGDRFKSGERVSLVLVAAEHRWTRTVTADADGTFTVRFNASVPRCGRYSLQAFGSKGSRARSLPHPRTDCRSAPTE